jgi:hypothetical protein
MLVFFMHDRMMVDCRAAPPIGAAEADLGNGRGEDTNDYF